MPMGIFNSAYDLCFAPANKGHSVRKGLSDLGLPPRLPWLMTAYLKMRRAAGCLGLLLAQ